MQRFYSFKEKKGEGKLKKISFRKLFLLSLLAMLMVVAAACSSDSSTKEESPGSDDSNNSSEETKDPIKIGVLASLSGGLESYGKQTTQGFELGLEYATDGTMEVNGQEVQFFVEDTETKPEVAIQKATKLIEEDGVDFLV